MAGKSEAADDLIAELAKLMAQDAQGDRTAKPAQAAPLAPVRIPGGTAQQPAAGQAADFAFPIAAANGVKTSPPSRVEPDALPPRPAPPAPKADPFQFDFDIRADRGQAAGLEDAPAVTAAPQPRQAPVVAPPAAQEHDSIADLISAEMASHPEPVPTAPAPQAAASPAAPLMSTVVPASSSAPSAADLGAASADQDRFRVPPVFGLGSVPPRAAPAPVASVPVEPTVTERQPVPPAAPAAARGVDPVATPDPIDEIESLIGRAMRVEFALPEDEARPVESKPVPEARPAPSPALRSLATPVLPTRQVPAVSADSLSVADQTIFAAAQASGAKLDWVKAPPAADLDEEPYQAAPRQRRAMGMSRALAGPLVAVTLLMAAGFGLYWVLGLGGRDSGPPPLLTADTAPVKEVAPPAAADDASAPQSVVFNEMDGVTAGADEQLVSRDQTDVNEVTEVASGGTDLSEEGLANRKVRTVKVRPDGTIVSGDDSVAGSAILPVDRPVVPAVPGAETASPELLAAIDPVEPVEAVEPAPAVEPAVAPTDPVATVIPVEPGATVPAVDLTGAAIAGKSATIPLMRPNGLRLASAAPAATAAPAAPVVAETTQAAPVTAATEVAALGDTAPAYVQLASQRSEADARQSAQNMVTRYGPLFGGANLEVQRVDLGARGIYYRVRVPAASLEQANVICTNVKAAGGDCFTM